MQRFSPRSEGSELHIPSLGVLHWEDDPLKHLFLKTSGAYFGESQITVGNTDFTLKECAQNLTLFETQGRSSNLNGACIRPTS